MRGHDPLHNARSCIDPHFCGTIKTHTCCKKKFFVAYVIKLKEVNMEVRLIFTPEELATVIVVTAPVVFYVLQHIKSLGV